ncbi:molecular chaperone HscC [Variovorax boronicumulans]|uniref:molecular chaperone HscC n=1 Tax=Variovorax boronicumulans TaxID=436515 RepID=UPI0027833767|nr:molecular chaperone HscC [Variovorax boronicumulans]MDP9994494.1 molecular chaperone HscC [Variovorax boronicumulans]MDQ0005807.1 molecular chaperone HscC [Variovorax boronicumulans]MDQ0038563.1 molecular chaperone HscC [Variovorax boronicumulans]
MIIGIDLGTTHSLAAVWKDGRSHLVVNALGAYLTPSCVSIDEDGSVLVGQAARDRLQTHPEVTASLFKRYMGSDKSFQLGPRSFRAEELSSLVLRSLKADAEAMLGEPVTEAVITVPAYFSDSQRKATRIAGQLAGLQVERLVNEPTAAALAYGLHQNEDATQFLVFDLGGGTFDVSILEMFEGVMEVRATAGDNFLGGEDFVNEIVQLFFAETGLPEAARADGGFMQQLVARAELAKRELSDRESATIALHWRDREHTVTLTQERFRTISEPLLARLRAPVERALRDASIRAGDIDNVVLAGGATRSPIVRQMVTRMFGRFPAMDINPDEVVALGAAVMAGLKARDAALKEVVMTDVCPYTLGVETVHSMPGGGEVDGYFSPIIERNTVVPASRVKRYVPVREGQRILSLEIFQGEARLVRDNIKLGTLEVPLPHAPRAEANVEVRFTYDVNGMLEVEATVLATQEVHRLVIQGNSGVLSELEIAARLAQLAELKIHPRDKAENRALVAQAERVFQQLRSDARERLGDEISRFELTLESQDERQIRTARERLRKAVGFFERDSHFDPDFVF